MRNGLDLGVGGVDVHFSLVADGNPDIRAGGKRSARKAQLEKGTGANSGIVEEVRGLTGAVKAERQCVAGVIRRHIGLSLKTRSPEDTCACIHSANSVLRGAR